MGKDLLTFYSCLFFQRFHLTPEVAPIFGFSTIGHEDAAFNDLSELREAQKLFPNIRRKKDPSILSFIPHFNSAPFHLLHSKIRSSLTLTPVTAIASMISAS